MEAPLPVSAQQALSVPTRDIEMPSGPNLAITMEHKLVEYITRLQVQGSYGQEIANPAALGSEVLSVLKGYLDRAGKLQQSMGGKVDKMGESDILTLSNNNGGLQNAVFTPGPAERYFEPAAPVAEDTVQAVPALSGNELDRAVQLLSELLSFSFETSFIATATTNVSKSANTLLHGQ